MLQLAVTEYTWPDETVHLNWQLQVLDLAVQVEQALGDDVEVDYSERRSPTPPTSPFLSCAVWNRSSRRS
jgi:hypothetical protein